jgi:nucleotide-binding universal stress UspA family protein
MTVRHPKGRIGEASRVPEVTTNDEEKGMFKTIVLALDGSDGSRRAIPLAVELARRDGAKVVIAHVEELNAGKGGEVPPPGEEEVRAEIQRQAEEPSAQGTDASVKVTSIMVGGPAHAINAVAEEAGAEGSARNFVPNFVPDSPDRT